MERRRLLHMGGKLRSRQRVLEGGSKEVFPLEVPRSGRREEGCARKVSFAVGVNSCMLPGAGEQAPSSTGAAPRAAEARQNVSHRLQKEERAASSLQPGTAHPGCSDGVRFKD